MDRKSKGGGIVKKSKRYRGKRRSRSKASGLGDREKRMDRRTILTPGRGRGFDQNWTVITPKVM